MALERIDPFSQEDRFCLDHLLRYSWVQPWLDGKSVIDVACGLGFGTILMAEANASSVLGVDLDEASVEQCRKWWKHPRIEFRTGRIEGLGDLSLEPVDRVVCFETLEHIENPGLALQSITRVLKEDGILIGSVPGETDWTEDNEFHLQFFNPDRLGALVRKHFQHVRLYQQRFHLASMIEDAGQESPDAVERQSRDTMRIDFGSDERLADTYLFIASNAELPAMPSGNLALSRHAWHSFFSESSRSRRELDRLHGRFRQVFFQHGDLKRRFANVLAWGKYWHEQASGKEPQQAYLDKIEQAKSDRESDLRAEVASLQRENERLRKELDSAAGERAEGSERKRKAFLEGLKSFITPPQ